MATEITRTYAGCTGTTVIIVWSLRPTPEGVGIRSLSVRTPSKNCLVRAPRGSICERGAVRPRDQGVSETGNAPTPAVWEAPGIRAGEDVTARSNTPPRSAARDPTGFLAC